jgi:hypothetical protein
VNRLVAIGDTVELSGVTATTWLFDGTAGQEVNVFLQALSADPADRNRAVYAVVVRDSLPNFLGHPVTSLGGDSSLELRSTGRITLPNTYRYGLTIGWPRDREPYTGPYRFWIYPINRSPESTSELLLPGDTLVGERIDHVGDIDEFRITALPGNQYNAFFIAEGPPSQHLRALIVGTNYVAVSSGADTALRRNATGRFSIGEMGTEVLLVVGEDDRDITDRGSYRVLLYPVNWEPELTTAVLVPSDSVIHETIELMGDVDQFRLQVVEPIEVNIVLVHESAEQRHGLQASLSEEPASRWLPQGFSDSAFGSRVVQLDPAKSYAVNVHGAGTVASYGYAGPYSLYVYRIDRAPELLPSIVTVGDTVDGEILDPVGDIDEFVLDAPVGSILRGYFQCSAPTGGLEFTVTHEGQNATRAYSFCYPSQQVLEEGGTGRFTLPWSGPYTVRVSGVNGGFIVTEKGPYRFRFTTFPVDPEVHAASVAIGDSITDEPIDILGDVDEFLLVGTPGATFVALFVNYGGGNLSLELLEVGEALAFDTVASGGWFESSGFLTLPPAGAMRLRVSDLGWCTNPIDCVGIGAEGPYAIYLLPVSRGPELVSAAVAIGDTVAGEAIEPAGDIDEYSFAATVARDLSVYFQTPQGTAWPGLTLDVQDPTTDSIFGSVTSDNPTSDLEDLAVGPFTIPADGTYLVRVRSAIATNGTGEYRFRIVAHN